MSKNNLQVIEKLENGQKKIYNSVFVDTRTIDILSNELALKIVSKLALSKACAMDLARDLEQHEQKMYYHLRRLEQAGIIKKIGTEKRLGMIAKMYTAISPVVSAKLYDNGNIVDENIPTENTRLSATTLFHPFIHQGRLDAKIIIGDPYSHGRFDSQSSEGNFAFDLALLMGGLIKGIKFPNYKLDTEVKESDLKNNLILIGSSKTNTIIDKINQHLPLYFDENKDFCVASRIVGKTYDDPRIGIFLKINNPFEPSKKILVLGGKNMGTRSALLACTNHVEDILSKADKDGNIICLLKGFDKDGDGVIDDIKILE